MRRISLIVLSLLVTSLMMAQQTGYYNGTEGKQGEELKAALNNIIKGHTAYSYYFSKEVFKLSDVDPNNSDNLILVYTGRSNPNGDYGTGGNQVNREHVWAKSHGNFGDLEPMNADVHNLKPADASVNTSRSNKDFDNGGTQHLEATECFYTDSTWEPRDAVKGDIARIIFYMSTRYEGQDGEIDLEVVDWNNTYPLPEHGKLSTLLAWNMMDPPDDFERNRNNVIYSFQQNRNPFIDDPNFANLIWDGAIANPISIDNIFKSPEIPVAAEAVSIDAIITNLANQEVIATLFWGLSFDDLPNDILMTASGENYSCDIPGQAEGATVYFKIVAADVSNENTSVVYNYYVPKVFAGTITSIYDIQGQQDDSPYDGEIVSTTGIVTANFGSSYFIQDGTGGWNGLFIYESGRNPFVGDSIVLTGTITEYFGKTEMSDITDYYFISSGHDLPEAVSIQTGLVEEQHESILVKVSNAMCTDDNYQANYYMWAVDDGSGDLKVHNTSVYEFEPVQGSYYDITGPMNYDFDEWKIELSPGFIVAPGTDTEGPQVAEVLPVDGTNIRIIYNEVVDAVTSQDVANYVIENVVVEAAVQHAFNKVEVNLTVTPLNGDYELSVQNVKDVVDNVMEPQTIAFSFIGPDTEGPEVSEVSALDETNVRVVFNEVLDAVTAQDISNYTIENVVIEAAVLHVLNNSEVNLTVSPLDGEYELAVQNVEDIAGNVMEPQTIAFSYLGIEEYLFNNEVNIYPNPVTDHVNISFISDDEFTFDLIITDMTGRQLIQKRYNAGIGDNEFRSDVNGLQQGIYLLSLRGETSAVNYKIVIR